MSTVIPLLLREGHDVIGVDTCQKWANQHKSRVYRFVQGDCCDASTLRPLMRGVDGVIQAAATLYGVVGFHRRAADILTNDVGVHHTVLRLSVASGIGRVVYLSSSIVYEGSTVEPFTERSDDGLYLPRTDYGLSKVVGERLSKAYWTQYNLPFTIWRPFNVIDAAEEGSDDAGVSHVFSDLIHRLIVRQQNPVAVLGDGYQVRSFVHIREVGEAIARFSFDTCTLNQTYNLGSSGVVTIRALANKIYDKACLRGLIRNPRPLTFEQLPIVETDIRRRIGSFAKAERELGWRSAISLDLALDECLDRYQCGVRSV
jgi:UDP-glucose 4-epimerase